MAFLPQLRLIFLGKTENVLPFPQILHFMPKNTKDIPSTLIIELLFLFYFSVMKVQLGLLVPEVFFLRTLMRQSTNMTHCGPTAIIARL